MRYTLPCSPTILCEDRFDLLGSNELQVPFWQVFEAAVTQEILNYSDLIDLLETISITLHGHSKSDYAFLREFLQQEWQWAENVFVKQTWPALVKLALEMPALFPDMFIPMLSSENPKISLSRRQLACLVIHQFFCSLPTQPWPTDSFVDFHTWYSSGSRHPKATEAYLIALFTYFRRLGDNASSTSSVVGGNNPLHYDWPVLFILRESGITLDAGHGKPADPARFLPLDVLQEPIYSTKPSLLGVPDGGCTVFANKSVGFGQTGTQEEIHVGTSPECCPIVLITPPLQDRQAVIVRGVEAMVQVNGYGRNAEINRVGCGNDITYDFDKPQDPHIWRKRTMLFMDALELDMADSAGGLPDFLPGHVDRELTKAFAAFSSYKITDGQPYEKIITGLWGCGAFGGNKEAKSLIQWCAASFAGIPLSFVCSGDDDSEFALALENFIQQTISGSWTIEEVLHILRTTKPTDTHAQNMFSHIIQCLTDKEQD